jgi:hypothetical protein
MRSSYRTAICAPQKFQSFFYFGDKQGSMPFEKGKQSAGKTIFFDILSKGDKHVI